MKQKIVLFDIDYTLFDTSYFHTHFHKKLAHVFNLNEEKVQIISAKIMIDLAQRDSYLDIDAYVELVAKALNRPKENKKIEDILFHSFFFKDGIYQEVGETLAKLKGKVKIGIFSRGDPKLQRAKIDQSGFIHYFDEDIIYLIKPQKLDFLPELKKKHQEDTLYFVDDKPSVIMAVKESIPTATTIWIKRGIYLRDAENLPDFNPDYTLETLLDVPSIIDE